VEVLPDLSVPGHPEIYVIGDLAHGRDAAGNSLPGVAPVAMQEAAYVAARIANLAKGRPAAAPFRFRDPGQMATIGRGAAVAQFARLKFSGYGAWLAWLAIHLTFLIEFENRMLVLMQWAWNYITWNRGARLITGSDAENSPGPGPAPGP
jgi:NADH dehydrogenase